VKIARSLVPLLVLAGIAGAQTPAPPTLEERLRYHVIQTVGPPSLLGTGFTSAIGLWRDAPHDWGQGMEGYGRRYAYSMAGNASKNAMEFAAGAVLREDLRYFRSRDRRFSRRVLHIVRGTFLLPGGGARPAYARFAGSYGAGFLTNVWYPQPVNGPGHGVLRGTYLLLGDLSGNAFREFWPDLKKKLRRKRP